MKQILLELKEISKILSFTRKAFTKGGFRHFNNYIGGLITLNKKTIKQISRASKDETHHSAITRILSESKFEQELLEDKYLKKIKYVTKGQFKSLILDDTLNEKNGKHIEATQSYWDHSENKFITGHQFFTAIIFTPILFLPLFPKLYSKLTDSKIDMAKELIDEMIEKIGIDRTLFDSWYSDKEIINKCIAKKVEVVCAIKINRKISLKRNNWISLKQFSVTEDIDNFRVYNIGDDKYKIRGYNVKLKGVPQIKMIISCEYGGKEKGWIKPFHLISTNPQIKSVEIVRIYKTRWIIETFHRDIKQNLGFAKAFLRKKEGIVRHAIFSTLAFAILKLFMYQRGMVMTIGECISYIQDNETDSFIRNIVEIEDKNERMSLFEEGFIRKTAKV